MKEMSSKERNPPKKKISEEGREALWLKTGKSK
jgi:hypothetical protein